MKSILTSSIFLFCFFHVTKACNETITWSRENELNFIPNVPSAKECFEICFSTNNCTAYTWYGSLNKLQDVCILFEAQQNQYDCENCLSGLVENGISCYCSQEGECLFDENNYLGDMFANSELDCFLECLNLPGNFHATFFECPSKIKQKSSIPECNYYTWFNDQNQQIHNQCLFFSTCDTIQSCGGGCFAGNVADCYSNPSSTSSTSRKQLVKCILPNKCIWYNFFLYFS